MEVGLGTCPMRETPFVQVDPEVLRSNIDAMQTFCDSRGLALRPHAKTHKCLEVAELQLSAGAVGLSVATVGEAKLVIETTEQSELRQPEAVAIPAAAREAMPATVEKRTNTGVSTDGSCRKPAFVSADWDS